MPEPGSRTCFCIMPIRRQDSPDHAHFRAIYFQIRQVVLAEGFEIVRADEVTEEGSVAKDVITRLAHAALVIADLTDLNPNVFWELGVRHTLRASGTLLLLDETRTEDPPFDLGYLRILKYRGTVEGLVDLRDQLMQFVRSAVSPGEQVVHSPVHEWIRHLPPDLSLPSSESEAALRSELSEYRDRLQRYARKYGSLDEQDIVDSHGPAERMRRMRRLAESGLLSTQMIEALNAAVEKRDIRQFIETVGDAIDNRVVFSPNEILRMSGWSASLDLDEVTEAILAFGQDLHPTHKHITNSRLAQLADGRSPEDRANARDAIARTIGFDLTKSRLLVDNQTGLAKADFNLIGFLAQSLHGDGLVDEAVKLCEAFAESYPDRASVLRLLGRAQEWAGDQAKGTETMLRALAAPDLDDMTSTWLGNSFHNCGRHVDALELYLISAWIDSDDSNWFSHCADEIAFARFDPYALHDPHSPIAVDAPRDLPPEVGGEWIERFVRYAVSAGPTTESLTRASDVIRRSEIAPDVLDFREAQTISRTERRRGVAELYNVIASALTDNCPARARPRMPGPVRSGDVLA